MKIWGFLINVLVEIVLMGWHARRFVLDFSFLNLFLAKWSTICTANCYLRSLGTVVFSHVLRNSSNCVRCLVRSIRWICIWCMDFRWRSLSWNIWIVGSWFDNIRRWIRIYSINCSASWRCSFVLIFWLLIFVKGLTSGMAWLN